MVSGIYKIESNDGKIYVGSAVNIQSRWKQHINHLNANKHHSVYLQRAWNKYGAEYFTFSILQVVEDKAHLLQYEQLWLNEIFESYNRADIYNISATAGSRLGTKQSLEAKAKMSESRTGLVPSSTARSNMSKAQLGNKNALGTIHTAETRAKYAARQTGRRLSEETKAKISASKRRK